MSAINPQEISEGVFFWFEDWPTARASLYAAAFLLAILLFVIGVWSMISAPKTVKFATFAIGFGMVILILASYLLTAYTFGELLKFNVFMLIGLIIGLAVACCVHTRDYVKYLMLSTLLIGLYVTLNGFALLLRSLPSFTPIFYLYRESAGLTVIYFLIALGSFIAFGNLILLIRARRPSLNSYYLIHSWKWRLALNLIFILADCLLYYALIRFPFVSIAAGITVVNVLLSWHIAATISKDDLIVWFCWMFSLIGLVTILFGLNIPNIMVVTVGALIISSAIVLFTTSGSTLSSVITAKPVNEEEERLLSDDESDISEVESRQPAPQRQSHSSTKQTQGI